MCDVIQQIRLAWGYSGRQAAVFTTTSMDATVNRWSSRAPAADTREVQTGIPAAVGVGRAIEPPPNIQVFAKESKVGHPSFATPERALLIPPAVGILARRGDRVPAVGMTAGKAVADPRDTDERHLNGTSLLLSVTQ
jgi:hypothetical protein